MRKSWDTINETAPFGSQKRKGDIVLDRRSNAILCLDLCIMLINSIYSFIPQRVVQNLHRISAEGEKKLIRYSHFLSIFLGLAGIMNTSFRDWILVLVMGMAICCGGVFLGERINRSNLVILKDEVKKCFVCVTVDLSILFFWTVNWKNRNIRISGIVSAMVIAAFMVLVCLCLRLIWNGMISLDKMNRKKNGIQLIFINSMGIISLVVLTLSNMVYWLAVWDRQAYQINGNQKSMSVIDSVYYTVTTITTVGYGDIVPADELSRMLAVIVQVMGLLIISGFAVNVISFITAENNYK